MGCVGKPVWCHKEQEACWIGKSNKLTSKDGSQMVSKERGGRRFYLLIPLVIQSKFLMCELTRWNSKSVHTLPQLFIFCFVWYIVEKHTGMSEHLYGFLVQWRLWMCRECGFFLEERWFEVAKDIDAIYVLWSLRWGVIVHSDIKIASQHESRLASSQILAKE